MKAIKAIIFRYLTSADFFNMYKPTKTEVGGGGQLYIDFLTSKIPLENWRVFFNDVDGVRETLVKNGPEWQFPISSIGITGKRSQQTLRIYQRRNASICIPNQNIHTRSANRVHAWAQSFGFPAPDNPRERHSLPPGLVVFLVRTYDRQVWAGWYQNTGGIRTPCQDDIASSHLRNLIRANFQEGDVEIIWFKPKVLYLDEENGICPFTSINSSGVDEDHVPSKKTRQVPHKAANRSRRSYYQRTDEEIITNLFSEDISGTPKQKYEVVVKVRRRNQDAVRDLKELYRYRCQISGEQYSFLKRDGSPYTEAHHLVPLGNGGADNPRNMIIVNPLLHRMLHYANVSGIELSKIIEKSDGTATLSITINGKEYTIVWQAEHANRIKRWEAARKAN